MGSAVTRRMSTISSIIFANLPQKMYIDVITTMRVIVLRKYDLKKVVTELKEKWKRDIKTGDAGKDTESREQGSQSQ